MILSVPSIGHIVHNMRSEEHTSELHSRRDLVCRLLLEKKKPINPFQVGIAQQLAQMPLLSAAVFWMVFLSAAVCLWIWGTVRYAVCFFFNDTATTEIYTLSLHDALPI